ncbi:MAG: hypothetical protein EOO62_30270 [Hymenobacter sp.]|nr:MAG: hypothetical protein EOO62_30270 [Hymenobacter sp.]
MNFFRVVVSGILLASPFFSHAQATEPASTSKFYGGLGVYTSNNQQLGSWYNGAQIPVQAVVGYQLRPRLAVQLGVAYSGNRNSYDYPSISYYTTPPTTVANTAGTFTERRTTTTLLARYTLTKKPHHRFQADVIGGVKFEYNRYHDIGTQTTPGQPTPVATAYDNPSTYNSTQLSIGPSLRYRIAARLQAVYDLTFDQPVSNGGSRYGLRPTSTIALGLRYHFGAS